LFAVDAFDAVLTTEKPGLGDLTVASAFDNLAHVEKACPGFTDLDIPSYSYSYINFT
jgi:hypothetical protein